jgi:hypothetical protein
MRPALVRVDVVRKREDGLDVGRVPLHRHLDLPLLGRVAVRGALEIDDVLVDRILLVVDVGDEVPDPAFRVELMPLLALTLVDEDDSKPLGQERGLAQALDQDLRRPLQLVEDLQVGQKRDRRPRFLGRADLLQVGCRLPARELLAIRLAVALHLHPQPGRQRVDHGDSDTVQAAGDLVPVAAELPARVQLRQDDRHRRLPLVLHHVDRDAGAVVGHGHRVVGVEGHLDQVRSPCERLVDRVVDHLEDEVMEPASARRADVHARAQPDRLEALENGDVLGGIGSFSQ